MSNYLTPSQIAQQYLLYLKTLKPSVNTDQTDSDWWIRAQVVGGVFSGVYADQQRISNDAFPQSARHDALLNHLSLYFNGGFIAAQPAVGSVTVTGATGSTIAQGTNFQYAPNGNLYVSTAASGFGSATAINVPVTSVASGQNQNLQPGAILSLPSPPAGINNSATVVIMQDGRDDETDAEAASRILLQVRTPLAGGKVADYEAFALAADPSVTSASVIRFPFGFGTVGVVITAGTTNIDSALNFGIPVSVIPSSDLVAKVQNYIETQNPVTDCATVFAPATTTQDVTVNVRYVSGHNSTAIVDPISGQTLTQAQFVQREVKRAIYKTPPGGRIFGASGYIVKSEIEETIDVNLSGEPYITGSNLSLLSDRDVNDLTASGPNRAILPTEICFPGNITVVEMS